MNVAGISSTPAQAPVPVVTPVAATTHASANPREHERHAEDQNREQQRRTTIQVPKMKPLSTTEVQVMLGMAPPEALQQERDEQRAAARSGRFDSYV